MSAVVAQASMSSRNTSRHNINQHHPAVAAHPLAAVDRFPPTAAASTGAEAANMVAEAANMAIVCLDDRADMVSTLLRTRRRPGSTRRSARPPGQKRRLSPVASASSPHTRQTSTVLVAARRSRSRPTRAATSAHPSAGECFPTGHTSGFMTRAAAAAAAVVAAVAVVAAAHFQPQSAKKVVFRHRLLQAVLPMALLEPVPEEEEGEGAHGAVRPRHPPHRHSAVEAQALALAAIRLAILSWMGTAAA